MRVPITSLAEYCAEAIIVAHHEDTSQLRDVLASNGFSVSEVRGPYTPDQLAYSKAVRCLVNHAHAWQRVIDTGRPVIVVEADFVPVLGFGTLPAPFPVPRDDSEGRFGWLYSAGSILYGADAAGFPHGHGNTTVAYVLNPGAALALADFFARETEKALPGEYRPWETYLGVYLRWERGVLNYIPTYQYGEHGGLANPEHAASGARAWHEADILWRRLAFLPAYAQGNRLTFRLRRLRGWLRGVARLLTRRFYNPGDVNPESRYQRWELAAWSVLRLLKLAPVLRPCRIPPDSESAQQVSEE